MDLRLSIYQAHDKQTMRSILHPFSPNLVPLLYIRFVLSPAFLKYNTKCVAYAKALHINEKYIRPHKKHIQLQQKKNGRRKELMT
jgi:hypothetical protein